MVVMFFPETCETGVEQERMGAPSACTVQAPHKPAPQPNFVPVSSSVSRSTQSSGVSGETLTFFSLPLTRSVMSAMFVRSQCFSWTTIVLNLRKNGNGRPFNSILITKDTKGHEGNPQTIHLQDSSGRGV